MQKTVTRNRLLSMVLILALIVLALPMTAMAGTNPTSLSGFASPVGSITVSGVEVKSAPAPIVTTVTSGQYTNNKTYTYNIELAAGTTANPVVTFTKASGVAAGAKIITLPPAAPSHMVGGAQDTLTYNPTLTNGVATFYTIAHHDVQNSYGRADTYYFNFTVAADDEPEENTSVDIIFGDPAYPSTAPECYMSLSGSNGNYNAVYSGPKANYYPNMLTMKIDGDSIATINATGGAKIVTYSIEDGKVEHTSITPATNLNNGESSDLYTIKIGETAGSKIVVKDASNQELAIVTFAAPQESTATAATGTPDKVNGYLPIGQFATGSGWGSVSGKLTGGVESTGVSLGMLGGYVQFDMGEGKMITNNANHKYGIDFIVYGNAFVGNPEAGSVMVSVNGDEWYNLAGSRHYMAGTEWDVDASFLKIDSAATIDGAAIIGGQSFTTGMYYSTNFDYTAAANNLDAAIGAATWTNEYNFGATAWWPDEGVYANGWNDGTVNSKIAGDTGDVFWYSNEAGNVEVITYCGVTRVQDDFQITGTTDNSNLPALTDCYQWGYADVRENGNSYGTAINPYASNASVVAGGDGFDLSWAVDADGNPVSLDGVRYVRVYSSVYYYAGIFGETSTEVCGLYVANGTGSGAANNIPTLKAGRTPYALTQNGTTTLAAGDYKLTSTAANVFVNGTSVSASGGYDITLESGDMVQIITQNGTESPFVTVIKCN